MKIIIPKEKNFPDGFYDWLLPEIRDLVIADTNEKKLLKIDEYINANKYFHSIFRKNISSKDILYSAVSNLKIFKYWDRTEITFDSNLTIPNTTTKMLTVVKVINFGTIHIMGYAIITKCFKYIQDNIDEFYNIYEQGV